MEQGGLKLTELCLCQPLVSVSGVYHHAQILVILLNGFDTAEGRDLNTGLEDKELDQIKLT